MRSLVLFLATRRITGLVVDDTIFNRARDQVWDAYPPETSLVGYFLTCRRCSSIWAALIVLILARRSSTRLILDILALSEASILLDSGIEAIRPKSLMN